MILTNIFCGKGGVGKTTSTVSAAICCAETLNQSVLIIDYDGGHSVKHALRLDALLPSNMIHQVKKNIFIATVDQIPFQSIIEYQDKGKKSAAFAEYFDQFKEDHGLVAMHDMVYDFFAILTDTETVQRLIILTNLLHDAKKFNIERVFIDVEPTAGFERLLSKAEHLLGRLSNLKNKSWLYLSALSLGGWDDITRFLKSNYIQNIDLYIERLQFTVSVLKKAAYAIVCIAEPTPVAQTREVKKIIEGFGAQVSGYVINKMTGMSYEGENILPITETGLPIVRIQQNGEINNQHTDPIKLYNYYSSIGEDIMMTLFQ